MGTMKARIERLETQGGGHGKRETEQERLEREAGDRSLVAARIYWDEVQGLFDALEDEHKEVVFADLDGAKWEDTDLRLRGEFGNSNGFALLTNALLSLAAYNVTGRKVPHRTIPYTLCQWFARQPDDLFQHPEHPFRNEETTRRYFKTRWQWLEGSVACQTCWLPVPCCGGYSEQIPRWIEEGDPLENLPFKACPACGGPIAWNCSRR